MTHTGEDLAWDPSCWRGRRVVLLANGEPPPPDFVHAVVSDQDVLIAADGGARVATAAGLVPHLVVGDLDSLSASEVAGLQGKAALWRHPPAKDASDLELALDCALAVAPPEVVVLGALGGRLDHALINVGLLHRAAAAQVPACLLAPGLVLRLVTQQAPVRGGVGTLVSLVALTPRVTGVTLAGLQYPLRDATLSWGSSRGLSNIVVSPPASVRVADGVLLLIETDPAAT